MTTYNFRRWILGDRIITPLHLYLIGVAVAIFIIVGLASMLAGGSFGVGFIRAMSTVAAIASVANLIVLTRPGQQINLQGNVVGGTESKMSGKLTVQNEKETAEDQSKPKERVSAKEKARILRESGVNVYQWFEYRECELRPFPTIFFTGDEGAGLRAVRIMQEHGFSVATLSREWDYGGSVDFVHVKWALIV